MSEMGAVQSAPDISFIDDQSVEDIRAEMVADFEAFMSQAIGKTYTLERASPHRMELYAAAAQFYHGLQYVDRAGKQNLLKYSYSGWLDNVVRLKGVTRKAAEAAATTLRFTLSAVRPAATGIPQGTRVSTATGAVYFQTEEYAEIPAGAMFVDVGAVCTEVGTDGNGLTAGELSVIVDPVPYMDSVANITETTGGADVETDANLAERAFLAPSSYSTAGPDGAYRYWVKSYNAAIGDVQITSDQEAGTVDICFLMADGSAPGEEMINGVLEWLAENNVRPMNDLVRATAPAEVPYTVNVHYWINRSDTARAATIQAAVTAAVDTYTRWQRTIGRDINPSQLVAAMIAAGAKRVEVLEPIYTPVGNTEVATLAALPGVYYGGLEND